MSAGQTNAASTAASFILNIKDGKIWIQHDGTEVGIALELVKQGVPKHDIVLGFHAPFKRQFTEFAIGCLAPDTLGSQGQSQGTDKSVPSDLNRRRGCEYPIS